MKKVLFISLASMALFATSCDDNNDEDWKENTINLQTTSAAVIIPSNTSDDVTFIPEYALRYEQSVADGKVAVKSMTPIKLPDETTFSFYSPSTSTTGNQLTILVDPMPFKSDDGRDVRLRTRLTSQYFNYDSNNNQILQTGRSAFSLSIINIATQYTIKTFQPQCYFSGKTNTLINNEQPFTNPNILYAVDIDIANRKATVTMFNAKFAEAAPNIRVLRLRNLSFVGDRSSGYRIEGTNVVPEVQEGNQWIPNQHFTFDSFSLVPTSENLSVASINYRVAGIYTGSCTGSYIVQ